MADPQPLVCVFFQLPPSDQLFMRIHDLSWLVLLPQIEKLAYALEALLVTNPSPMAMEVFMEAREAMGSKMLPIRDAILESWDLSKHYIRFANGASNPVNLVAPIKEAYTFIVQTTIKKVERAQQALFEFREELESVVGRITSLVGGDSNHLSQFVAKSSQIISVMIPAIEECSALLQECNESFGNLHKLNYDVESYERNTPSRAELQMTKEKWLMFGNALKDMAVDWNTLKARMANPIFNRVLSDITTPDVRNTTTQTGVLEGPTNLEAPPELLPPKKAKVPFWQKLFQRVSTCISSRPFS